MNHHILTNLKSKKFKYNLPYAYAMVFICDVVVNCATFTWNLVSIVQHLHEI